MKEKERLGYELNAAAQDMASKLVDRMLRERKLIPLSILRDYIVSNESEREVLIQNYGEEFFRHTDTDAIMFAGFMGLLLKGSDKTTYPFNFDGQVYNITITKQSTPSMTVPFTHQSSHWILFKQWLKNKFR